MNNTVITLRTDEALKNQASVLFESMGMNLSVAINMFLRQAVAERRFPCSLDLNISRDCASTYPEGFFKLAGLGVGLGLDEEPEELSFTALEDIEL